MQLHPKLEDSKNFRASHGDTIKFRWHPGELRRYHIGLRGCRDEYIAPPYAVQERGRSANAVYMTCGLSKAVCQYCGRYVIEPGCLARWTCCGRDRDSPGCTTFEVCSVCRGTPVIPFCDPSRRHRNPKSDGADEEDLDKCEEDEEVEDGWNKIAIPEDMDEDNDWVKIDVSDAEDEDEDEEGWTILEKEDDM